LFFHGLKRKKARAEESEHGLFALGARYAFIELLLFYVVMSSKVTGHVVELIYSAAADKNKLSICSLVQPNP